MASRFFIRLVRLAMFDVCDVSQSSFLSALPSALLNIQSGVKKSCFLILDFLIKKVSIIKHGVNSKSSRLIFSFL